MKTDEISDAVLQYRSSILEKPILVVGVIVSMQDFDKVMSSPQLKNVCDVFEIRLDKFDTSSIDWSIVDFPLLFTARSPKEGGGTEYLKSDTDRINSLRQVMQYATMIDIEISNVSNENDDTSYEDLLHDAQKNEIKVIGSVRFCDKTPSIEVLNHFTIPAEKFGFDVCKISVKIQSEEDIILLLTLLKKNEVPQHNDDVLPREYIHMSIDGVGEKFGPISKVTLPCFGSKMVYGYISDAYTKGELSIFQIHNMFKDLIH
jgi:3-dehydroquinate dehydratase type I